MSDDVVGDDFDEVIENVTMCSECDDYMDMKFSKSAKLELVATCC